ncbi:MAG: ABC transporter ATP-binding protein [Hyphomicrobiales bacterium]|nr:ABC transporter ATP-binding protein [Hyphomicrobiales bacterium]
MTEPLLHVRDLTARYGAAQILFGISFDLNAGEAVALMGRNGAGKSTTMKAILGLIDARAGVVVFRGEHISRWPTYKIARAGLAYAPEDRRIFADLTVRENLDIAALPARPGREPWTHERIFALFPNLREAQDRSAARMSGGEQQMLTVARALMGNPYALLLDEPSEGVAPIVVEAMAETVLKLKGEGVAILLSEQNLPFAARVCDRAYVLEKGEIRFSGAMDALMRDEAARRAWLEV